MTTPSQSGSGSQSSVGLDELFNRVNQLLGDPAPVASSTEEAAAEPDLHGTPANLKPGDAFIPRQPQNIRETGVSAALLESLIMKFLFQVGRSPMRGIAAQLKLSFKVIEPILKQLRSEKNIDLSGTTNTGDSEYVITDLGRERGKRYYEECTYFGATPVSLQDYIDSVNAQSIAGQVVTSEQLKAAFDGLIINQAMLNKLGPAVNSGRGMFLYGFPGNGKTSIAERVTDAFGSAIWMPRAIFVEGEVMRVFDPGVHEEVEEAQNSGLLDSNQVDRRWVKVKRPTVIAGGELTMDELEVTKNEISKICEAPLQLKSNCGTLVIDDFGRQTMPVDVLLNRWIVPLEKRYDFMNLPSGKKLKVPFDQLIVFSTNLEPRDLVDGAFLRRIPYKIEVPDPSVDEFRELFGIMSRVLKFPEKPECVEYLIQEHYLKVKRPFRLCQPRDLLLQVQNYCNFHQKPLEISNEAFDFAVSNYFSIM
ncbi:MAG: AAA family ATPase [Planctomycetaceae bacterium]|nr:AAA family ATPase [Planctomycetaceae bacterium]